MRGISALEGEDRQRSTAYQDVVFGGEKGALATEKSKSTVSPGVANLKKAKEMEGVGKPAMQTFHTTGWYHAPDGNWKWVLPDSGASLNTSAFKITDPGRPAAIIKQPGGGPVAKREARPESLELQPGKTYKLSEVLNHPDLYVAYPHLKDTTVSALPEDYGSTVADFDREKNAIRLGGNRPRDVLLQSLLHEIQHGVQNYEGFGVGGDPSLFYPPGFAKMSNPPTIALNTAIDKVKNAGGNPFFLAKYYQDQADGIPIATNRQKYFDQLIKELPTDIVAEHKNAVLAREPVRKIEDRAYEDYLRTAGETEARQAEQQLEDKDWTQLPTQMPGFKPGSEQIVRKAVGGNGYTIDPGKSYQQITPVENDPFTPPPNAHYPSQKVPDFTNNYNSYLDPDQEANFQTWLQDHAATKGRDMSKDLSSYDLRGAYLNNSEEANNGHWPDTYKKPNHPGFSDSSIWNGADGYQGGKWTPDPDDPDQWSYEPSQDTLNMHGEEGVRTYLKNGQGKNPPVQLILPKPPLSYEFSPVENDPFDQVAEPQFAPVEYDPFQSVTPNINVSPKLMPPQSALSPMFGFDYSDYPDLASAAQGNQAPAAEPTSYSTFAKPVNTIQPSSY